MSALIHDTVFGHLVRFLSGGRYLRYSDEIDSTPWKHCLQQDQRLPDFVPRKQSHFSPSNSSQGSSSTVELLPWDDRRQKGWTLRGAPVIVSWTSADDHDNPRNWPLWKKCFVTFELCLLTTSVYIGSSMYVVGIDSVIATFNVSYLVATLGLCLFVAGYGIGPMLWSSMSEVPQIGRNPIYVGTLAVFVALQIPTARASSLGMLLAFRFLTGFFGSPVLATGGASMADIWAPAKRAYAISLWGDAAIFGPSLGPLVGAFAVQYAPIKGVFTASWTWPIWILTWASGACLIVIFFFLPETNANNILVRRTQRLRKEFGVGKDQLICQAEMIDMTGRDVVLMVLIRPLTLNFTEPMVLIMNLYIALLYGLLYIWFESFPIVFQGIYHFDDSMTGLSYLGILSGLMIVTIGYFIYLHRYLEPQFDAHGDIRPEARLTAAFVGCLCVPICLFWFGWSARPEVHWIMPIIGSAWFPVGMFLLFNSILNYLPDAYPDYVASVMAGNDLMRSAFGAGFPLFATAMYKNLGTAWASSTLGFIAVAFIPVPFILYKYGETLRKKYSRHARKDI